MSPEPCEHHWIHYGQPSHSPIRWIVKCSQCNQFRIADLQEQVDEVIAAAEQRGAIKALRDAAESHDVIDHMYKYFDNHPIQAPAAVRATATYLHNRADQMEGDDA